MQFEKEEYDELINNIIDLHKISVALYNQNIKMIVSLLNFTKHDADVIKRLKEEKIIE